MSKASNIARVFLFCMALSLPVSALAAGHAAGPGISAEAALNALHQGNLRYLQGKLLTPNTDPVRRMTTAAKGQHPFAMVLACADSRVPVETLFDRGIGDIFVSRVAGNVVSPSVLGTLEYGADHLGIPLLVVLGHTNCGAVTAVFQEEQAHGNLAELLQPIVPAVEKAKRNAAVANQDCKLDDVIKENVRQTIADIRDKSPELAAMEKDGKLLIIGALYDINSGKVAWTLGDEVDGLAGRCAPGMPSRYLPNCGCPPVR